jgi:hypothetical protein
VRASVWRNLFRRSRRGFQKMMCVDTYEDLKQSVSTIDREPERVPETTQHPKHNPNNNIENRECQIGGDIRSESVRSCSAKLRRASMSYAEFLRRSIQERNESKAKETI